MEGESSYEGTSSSQGNMDVTLDDKQSAAFSASTTGPFAADNNDEEINDINHCFGGMDFDKVQVAGSNIEVYTELRGDKN